ncbi:hypothetical protein QAD02_002257 [Eretmocerus hayati]|uniref:Uncharacterized protein n=1 Tax=Eretmocerus hayati TaxID=131215 RepID=A0ACC2NJK6_9HYME|nr:hypothetical protein QAD02_002257 [Eretmocerus hayati]
MVQSLLLWVSYNNSGDGNVETESVAVAVLGPNDEFPAFYSRRSLIDQESKKSLRVGINVEDACTAAELVHAQFQLHGSGGLIIAVPIPEEYEIPAEEIQPALEQVLVDAVVNRIRGKDVTPFLLHRLALLTDGRSLSASKYYARNFCHSLITPLTNTESIEMNPLSLHETVFWDVILSWINGTFPEFLSFHSSRETVSFKSKLLAGILPMQ